jgi:hypothetical protein
MAITFQIYNSDGKFSDVIANATHNYQRALKGKFLVFTPCVTEGVPSLHDIRVIRDTSVVYFRRCEQRHCCHSAVHTMDYRTIGFQLM